ncbi:hypothetical protein SAMN05421820_103376 [Pedobacter steynii]|uniref:Uncharacterized protein n=2 Tax=Pedobacter steynii TaxID=430522 RepID=A0A1G9RVK3_9SPHI|nr:hypothetical protein SAMN05421820_103376 [Pedobacter steynii]
MVSRHEMLRLWAIGEVYVELLNPENKATANKALDLLNSKAPLLEKEGIEQVLKSHHWSLIDFIPKDTVWYRAVLEVNKFEFNKLNTLPVADLARITNNTFRLAYAATIVVKRPDLNPRINGIINAMKKRRQEVQFSGITLLAKGIDGPYTILEGNGRLISLYHLEFIEKLKISDNGEIEVLIGLSEFGIV